jgi:hypothetical protein
MPFWACPKRCRFGQNGVVLQILGFFFFLKKKEIKKKKKEIGVAATPFPKMGWPDHPIFGQGPQAFGGGPATPKGQQKKKKREKWVLAFGGGRTTP